MIARTTANKVSCLSAKLNYLSFYSSSTVHRMHSLQTLSKVDVHNHNLLSSLIWFDFCGIKVLKAGWRSNSYPMRCQSGLNRTLNELDSPIRP